MHFLCTSIIWWFFNILFWFLLFFFNSTLIWFFCRNHLTKVLHCHRIRYIFSNIFNLFFLTFYVYVQFASFLFFNFKCNRFWHFCYIFCTSGFLFLRTCWFWILFFPFILLLNMNPGANTKKSADDITSNDRGEDEGIFCFFKAWPWCMNINFSIFVIIIMIIVIVIAVISTWFLVPYLQKLTSVCFFIFFFRIYFDCFSF